MMIRRDEVISKVRLLTLTEGSPATVLFTQAAVRPDGKQRTITQKTSVPAAVFSRLSMEVHAGDEIEATLVTEWTQEGYSTHLADFRSLPSEAATPILNSVIAA